MPRSAPRSPLRGSRPLALIWAGLALLAGSAQSACDRGLPSGGVLPAETGGNDASGGSDASFLGGTGGVGGFDTGDAGGATPGAAGGERGDGGDGDVFIETLNTDQGAMHVPPCSDVSYVTSPPSSGTHYSVWAAYKTYATPVPWGFLVHDLEHGAIDVVYNCPIDCPDEVAAAQAWIDSLPDDRICGGRPRIILAPDPTLTCRWAAAAWRWTLRGAAFQVDAFQRFYDTHYENPDPSLQAPEVTLCMNGIDEPADGWCN